VPLNWSAYEDIADFFTNDVKEIDGSASTATWTTARRTPSLGWRFTDAWLSMAGTGDGHPNGMPVDEWGIRMEGCTPVGSSRLARRCDQQPGRRLRADQVRRLAARLRAAGGAGHDLHGGRPGARAGHIAQQIFWYTAFTADMVKPGLPVMNERRHAQVAHGALAHGPYWEEGMKHGYQDVRQLDLLRVHAARAPPGGLAVRPVRASARRPR
jgi:glycerol transport system substrate-binding protein